MGVVPLWLFGEICLERLESFDFTGADYQRLFSQSNATAFQHPIWLERMFAVLVPAMNARPLVICGKRPRGDLLFVLPLVERRVGPLRIIEPADLGVGDYNAPVVSRNDERALRQMPDIRNRIEALLPAHDVLRIRHIRAEHRELWSIFFNQPLRPHDHRSYETELGEDHAAWQEATLDGSFRRYLERKIRRFNRSGSIRLDEITDTDEIADALRELADVRKGRFRKDPMQQSSVRDFYAQVAAAGVSYGLSRTYVLKLDGAPVGRVFGLTLAGRFYFLLLACDYENYGRHSPGLILADMLIRERRAAGDVIFDFTVGDEPYKADFGSRPQTLFVIETSRSLLGYAALNARRATIAARKLLGREGLSQRRWGDG